MTGLFSGIRLPRRAAGAVVCALLLVAAGGGLRAATAHDAPAVPRAAADTAGTFEVRLSAPMVLRTGFYNYERVMRSEVYPAVGLRLGRRLGAAEGGGFAGLYGGPVVGVGASWEGVHLAQRDGGAFPIHLATLYGFAQSDLVRGKALALELDLSLGLGLTTSVYDREYNPLLRNFSSALLVHVGGGLGVRWRTGQRSEVGLSLVYAHLSTGRLAYPNGGWNTLSAILTTRWGGGVGRPEGRTSVGEQMARHFPDFRRHWNYELFAGGGVHRCAEEWMAKGSTQPWPNYLLGGNASYMLWPHCSMGAEVDVMLCTGRFLDTLRAMERLSYGKERVDRATYRTPALGLGWVGQLHYGNLSAYGVLGVYAYRQLGVAEQEGLLYQRVGLKYRFPRLHNIFVAADCKAHKFSRAAIMYFTVGVRL